MRRQLLWLSSVISVFEARLTIRMPRLRGEIGTGACNQKDDDRDDGCTLKAGCDMHCEDFDVECGRCALAGLQTFARCAKGARRCPVAIVSRQVENILVRRCIYAVTHCVAVFRALGEP